MRVTYAGRQLPEIWIRQKRLERGKPVTTEQFMRRFGYNREDADRLLSNLERERRIKKITDAAGNTIGWEDCNAY